MRVARSDGQLVVKGHTLRAEGLGYRKPGIDDPWSRGMRGSCSCGEYSDPLNSDRARKRWHREHKQAVLAAADNGD